MSADSPRHFVAATTFSLLGGRSLADHYIELRERLEKLLLASKLMLNACSGCSGKGTTLRMDGWPTDCQICGPLRALIAEVES